MAEKDAESWTLSFLTAKSLENRLQYFMVRINSESRTLSFCLLDKAWKLGL
jgi:hypothetical protein